ncbi:MgtC/SapB family protein [Halomonas sp. 18H]|uniref:MgtC/SapB family protein n=1 Tax=Halomonas almeriensis TaxID=308163 RepID=UPI00223083B1|nr:MULTISPECIES: MgtC/SapB family protein [Halomonas]MCW4151885.1 MgtC/SapB family protein [Halomonas sp. 18H]MDN3554131.1 MgtC/SapB family protein [Halomonas almeriensis]
MDDSLTLLEMFTRLCAAAGLALVLGCEREFRRKPAGLRSHMLVALGAAAFLLVGLEILQATGGGDPAARIDPTRIVEGVIGGIGFLGAGSIIRSGTNVQGITTGASIWLAGAIGIAAGVGDLALAAMVTLLALIIMTLLGAIERALPWHKRDD